MTHKTFDLLCMGRITLDLFGDILGADFHRQLSFRAYTGGCASNICIAAHRMGLTTALLTGVSDDAVGDYLRDFYTQEGITTDYMMVKPGTLNNLALAAMQPPDRMQFVAYHALNADLQVTKEDVNLAPVRDCAAFLFTGMNLLAEPSRGATMHAVEMARRTGATIFMDADYRPPMWDSADAYRAAVRPLLPLVDYLIGTEEEVCAISDHDNPRVCGPTLLDTVHEAVVIKRGELGSFVYPQGREARHVPPFPVRAVNTLGAGDAFAGGFIYGWRRGGSLASAARLGNACGAIIVTEHGTGNAMPYLDKVLDFVDARGGF